MEITARILGAELDAEPEISEIRAIDDDGVPITSVLGVSVRNASLPPEDGANAVSLTLATTPASSVTPAAVTVGDPPLALAFTGVESSDLSLLALLLLATGGALVFLSGRRPRRVEADNSGS